MALSPSGPKGSGYAYIVQHHKNNNYTLPWISQRNEVTARIATLRGELRQVWLKHQGEYQVAQSDTVRQALNLSWNQYLGQLQEQLMELNKLIADLNLKQPGEQLEVLKLRREWELERAGAAESLGSRQA